MEKRPAYETDPAELASLRKKLGELASDIPGTLAKLAPEVQRNYREAEQSVIYARRAANANEGQIFITS